ncbi:MAG: DUF2953 domain-containing protein [Lachnospiraceae bacterium]
MLHIILLILKIIGWIILILLGIVFSFLLVVLFVPVRYEGKGTFIEKGNGRIRIHWFLPILSFQIKVTDNKFEPLLRIFGIPIRPGKKKKPKQRGKRQKGTSQKNRIEEPIDAPREEAEAFHKQIGSQSEEREDTTTQEPDTTVVGIEDNRSFIGKIINKIKAMIQKILQFIKKVFDTGKGFHEKMTSFQKFMNDEENKASFLLIKDQIVRILLHAGPSKWNVSLRFGLENPATTGEVLAVLACFMPILKDNLQITPDFTQTVFEGEFYIRGRIRFFTLLIIISKVYRDKNFRKLLKKF